jgi:hypothetical protein
MNSRETVNPKDSDEVRRSKWADLALNAVAFSHADQLDNENLGNLQILILRDVCD